MSLPNVSQRECILLHLLEHDRFRDEGEVPLALSQEGIAQRLRTQVHNASRSLASLENDGLIMERLAHIRGVGRRRRAYFLTGKGLKVGREITEDLKSAEVTLQEGNNVRDVTIKEILESTRGQGQGRISLLDIVQNLDGNGKLNAAAIEKKRREGARIISSSFGRPNDSEILGRENEISLILSSLESEKTSTVIIWGLPGIGKSALASRIFSLSKQSRPTFWYTITEWDTPHSFLDKVVKYIKEDDLKASWEASNKETEPAILFSALSQDLARLQGLIFLDDVHKASNETASIVRMIMEACRSAPSSKLILVTRKLPDDVTASREDIKGLGLSGLKDESARELAIKLGSVNPDEVVRASHGNPLLIRLLSVPEAPIAARSTADFVDELLSSLTIDERNLAEYLSVFRESIKSDSLSGDLREALLRLRRKGLILDEDGVRLHELVRDRIYSSLEDEERRRLHRRATSCYESKEAISRSELLFHIITGEDWAGFLGLMAISGSEIVEENGDELLSVLDSVPEGLKSNEELAQFHFWLGELKSAAGRFEEALGDYEKGLSSAQENSPWNAKLHEGMANLKYDRQKWTDALASHVEALRSYDKQGDLTSQAREELNIGSVYRHMGNTSGAREAYQKAMNLLPENESLRGVCLNNIALLDWSDGQLNQAEIAFKEAIRLAHIVRDNRGEGRALENLAQLYFSTFHVEEMILAFSEAASAFQRADDAKEAVRVTIECANILGSLNEWHDGLALLYKAEERLSDESPGLSQVERFKLDLAKAKAY